MRTRITRRQVELLAQMEPPKLRAWLAKCSPEELLALDAAFEAWASEGQLPPPGEGWRVWLMMGGRGFGKTRAGAEWIHQLALRGKKRIALVGATIDEARAVMVEGMSGLLSIAQRERVKVKWEPSNGLLSWPQGAVARLYSGDSPDGLRGPEHHFAWCCAAHRTAAVPGGGKSAHSKSSLKPGDRQLLSGGRRRNRGMGRPGRSAGRLYGWRLAICRPGRGHASVESQQRPNAIRTNGVWEIGVARAEVRIDGQTVLRQRQAAIAEPGGGTVVDQECRAAVAAILGAMRIHGLID